MGFDVAVEESRCMGLTERATGLAHHGHRPLRRKWREALDQRRDVHAGEQFHDEVEAAGLAHTEIVEPHRVRRTQARDGPSLQTEALCCRLPVALAEEF